MDDGDDAARYLSKADESLAGAGSEFSDGRFNNSANRSYYACFQVAIGALMRAAVRPEKRADRWSHEFVIGRFVVEFIHRQQSFPIRQRSVLHDLQTVRHVADYRPVPISELEAYSALRRARSFVDAIRQGGDRS